MFCPTVQGNVLFLRLTYENTWQMLFELTQNQCFYSKYFKKEKYIYSMPILKETLPWNLII